MNQERLLIDFIEDFDDEQVLKSAQHRLLVIEKNITNIKKNIDIYIHENEDTKQRIKIIQNRIDFIDNDIRSVENLKCHIEAKIAECIESVESPESLPTAYDPQLELFIDQKIEYYTNYVLHHRALKKKTDQIYAHMKMLQNIIEEHKKELVKLHQMVLKYNNRMPELRKKQVEISTEINAIENNIVEFLEGRSVLSEEINTLTQGRLQDVLDGKIRALMQLNDFAHHIQNEYDSHMNAIAYLNEKKQYVQEEVNRIKALFKETDIEFQTAEMKYGKVEQQIYTYINIQEEGNFVMKCRAYYDLIATYKQEKKNAQLLMNSFQEKNQIELFQVSSSESKLENLQEERRHLEYNITSLMNTPK